MPEITEFFNEMPTFTKTYVLLALAAGVGAALRLVNPSIFFVLVPNQLLNPKILLSYFYNGKLSINLIMQLYFTSLLAGRLELTYKPNRYADFLVLLLLVGLVCLILEIVVNYGGWILLSKSFMMGLSYIHCKRNPQEKIMIMFIFSVKAAYFPFAEAVMELLSEGGNVYSVLIGIAAGHLYIFLKDILPVSHRKDYLQTPMWAIKVVNWIQNSSIPYFGKGGAAQAFGVNQEGIRPFAGRGHRIG